VGVADCALAVLGDAGLEAVGAGAAVSEAGAVFCDAGVGLLVGVGVVEAGDGALVDELGRTEAAVGGLVVVGPVVLCADADAIGEKTKMAISPPTKMFFAKCRVSIFRFLGLVYKKSPKRRATFATRIFLRRSGDRSMDLLLWYHSPFSIGYAQK